MSHNSFASLPYIKGVTEPLTRILKKHEITVVNKPLKMLQQGFSIPKSQPPLTLQPDIVYKIPCGNCSWSYIGETGRSFATRTKEHIRNVKTAAKGSRIANHARSHDHVIDFNNTSIIDKVSSCIRKFFFSTVHFPEELVGMFFKLVDPTMSHNSFASLPYIKGFNEPLTRVLKKHEITVVNKPLKMLQQGFSIPKSQPPLTLQPDIVYKIPCGNCSWSYIGETGRSFAKRKKEHIRNVKTAAKGSRIANHAWSHDHVIDFNNTSIIDKVSSCIRKFLESWYTTITPNAKYNSCQLPGQYSILVN